MREDEDNNKKHRVMKSSKGQSKMEMIREGQNMMKMTTEGQRRRKKDVAHEPPTQIGGLSPPHLQPLRNAHAVEGNVHDRDQPRPRMDLLLHTCTIALNI